MLNLTFCFLIFTHVFHLCFSSSYKATDFLYSLYFSKYIIYT
nr:MAG TPA: hypothetical protein [Caudoviricetes sp.]DAX18874.1 MAG TPA: hypothetical protein [Caudoviricetes sp.]